MSHLVNFGLLLAQMCVFECLRDFSIKNIFLITTFHSTLVLVATEIELVSV